MAQMDNSVRITMYISKTKLDELKRIAEEKNVSYSWIVRRCVDKFIESTKNGKDKGE